MSAKPHHFTVKQDVKGKVSIWAIPRSIEKIKEGKDPFRFELHTRDPYVTGSVRIIEHEIELQLPAGIDLLAKAVETLKQQQKDIQARAQYDITQLQEQINQLQLLTHQPDPISGRSFTIDTIENSVNVDSVIDRANERFNKLYENDDDLPF